MRRVAATATRGFGHLFRLWLMATAGLVIASILFTIQRVAANDFRVASVDLVALAGPITIPADDPLDASRVGALQDLAARSDEPVRYGATEWTVVGSRLIPRGEDLASRPIVVTEVLVSNTDRNSAARIRNSDVHLVGPDGLRQEVDRFEFIDDRRLFSLDSGESLLVTLVFKPNLLFDPDLAELQLVVGERGRIPAILPILGPAPGPVFPLPGKIWHPWSLPGSVIDSPTSMPVHPHTVAVGLDAGLYRAAEGQRVIVVEVAVDPTVLTAPVATSADDRSYWSLRAGEQEVAPLRIAPSDEGVTLYFAFDRGPDRLTLTAAAHSARPVERPISLVAEPER